MRCIDGGIILEFAEVRFSVVGGSQRQDREGSIVRPSGFRPRELEIKSHNIRVLQNSLCAADLSSICGPTRTRWTWSGLHRVY